MVLNYIIPCSLFLVPAYMHCICICIARQLTHTHIHTPLFFSLLFFCLLSSVFYLIDDFTMRLSLSLCVCIYIYVSVYV